MIHQVVFFSSLARGISHFFTDTQSTTERVEEKNKQTNKQTRAWVSSKRKKERSLWHFLCIRWVNASVYSSKILTKPLAMLTCLLALVNPASVGQQVLAVVFLTPVLLSSLHCFHLLTASFWSPLSTNSLCLLWDLPSLVYFRSRGRISRSYPLCGFRAKVDKGILWLAPTHQYNECPT